MLIRICSHPVLNPHLIDKLIVVKGLPYEWTFKKVPQGDQLLPPWEPDVDANIPKEVRALTEPITYCKWFPDIRHYDQTYKGFWDTRTVYGLRLDYGYGPGQEMWNKIEDYIEGTIPRNEKMPVPVMVAPDQKATFSPVIARKSERGGGIQMISAEVPVIDLTKYLAPVQVVVAAPIIAPTVTVSSQPEPVTKIETVVSENKGFVCNECAYATPKIKALRMHKMQKHPAKEKAVA